MPFTSVFDESETAVVFDELNVAVSAAPLGTVAGVQFPEAFQFPDEGNVSHVALPAKAAPPDSSRNSASERVAWRKTVGQMFIVRSLSGPFRSARQWSMVVLSIVNWRWH